MRVLVTNGETRPALAITRSLGKQGHHVTVVANRQPAIASVSRYCAGREACSDPQTNPAAFVEEIVDVARRREIGLLLPVTEIATRLLAECRHRLPAGCILPLPADDALALANDKSQVFDLATRLGIPVPRTATLAHAGGEQPEFSFPLVIKPARSRVRLQDTWHSGATDYAADGDELRRKLGALPPELYPVLLQERIEGEGVGLFACYWNGRPVAFFSHRRLREKPPSGGVSVLSESVALDPVARSHAEQLLTTLGWHGVAMVEFKRDGRDGSLRLLEINGRFWGSLQLAIDANVNFPALVAHLSTGEMPSTTLEYRVGVRSRWFLGDLDALLSLFRHRREALNLPVGHPGRWRTLWDFAHFWRPGQRGEVLRFSDPQPGLLEIRQWLAGG